MSSFYNGVEGVKTQGFGIDITANNIANVNTTGFKYSGAEFKDIFYTVVNSQSSNPAQKGLGASYAASKLYFDQGSPMASDGEFDVALQGKGFFGVLGADGQVYYTRNGSFRRDSAGNLVDSYGNFVLGTMNPAFSGITYSDRVAGLMGNVYGIPVTSGYTVTSNGYFDMGTPASQTGLFVPNNMYLPPQTTQNVKFYGSLNSSVKTEAVKVDVDPTKFDIKITEPVDTELDPTKLNVRVTDAGKYIVSGSVSFEEARDAKAGDKVTLNFTDDNGVTRTFEATLDDNLNFVSDELDLDGLDPNTLRIESAQVTSGGGKYIVSGSVSLEEVFGAKPGDKVILNFTDDNGVTTSFEAILDENLNFVSNELDLGGLDPDTLQLSSVQVTTEQQKANKDTIEAPVYNADGSKSSLRLNLERVLPDVGGNIQYKVTAQIFNSNGEAVGEPTEGSLVFDENGALIENTITSISNPDGGSINLDLGTPYDPNVPGSGFSGVYIKEGTEKNISYQQDGVAEGFFNKYGIADDGTIYASFSNGLNAVVGKLALYNFINEQGLAAVGDNIFAATGNSGNATFIMSNGQLVNTAKFKGGYLEQSNVDLSVELSNLIVMQKAFDASSKSITTSDQMIQKAINMKR